MKGIWLAVVLTLVLLVASGVWLLKNNGEARVRHEAAQRPRLDDLDPDDGGAGDDQPVDERVGQGRDVRLPHPRPDIGPENGEALAVAHEDVGDGGAAAPFHHLAVRGVERRQAERTRRLDHRDGDGLRVHGGVDVDRPVDTAADRIAPAVPVFDAPVDLEDGVIAPARIARDLGEVIPVGPVPPRPDPHVDARPAAQHFPHVERHAAAI